MSPHQRNNPDQYQDRRPPERQARQGTNPPPTGGGQGGGRQQGPPPEQFRGQGSPQPGGQPPQGSPRQGGAGQQQPPQQRQQPQQQPPNQSMQQSPQQPPQQQGAPGGMGATQQRPAQQLGAPGSMGGMGGMQGPGLESASIDEILHSEVVTVQREASIMEIVETMDSEEVGSVIVVEDDEPVGIITDRSVALALRESTDLSDWTADEFVSDDLVTGETEMTVFEVLDKMEDEAIRRLPIVDDDGSLAGIVALDDIFVLLNAEMDNATDIIESQSPRF